MKERIIPREGSRRGGVKNARLRVPFGLALSGPFLWVVLGVALGATVVEFVPNVHTLVSASVPAAWNVDSHLATAARRSNRDRMTRLFLAFHQVAVLEAIPPGQTVKVTSPQTDTLIYSEVERGLAIGDSVDDAYLDWLDPSIKRHFRNELLFGARVYLKGLRNQDRTTEVAGLHIMDQWQVFWRSHVTEVTSRALAD